MREKPTTPCFALSPSSIHRAALPNVSPRNAPQPALRVHLARFRFHLHLLRATREQSEDDIAEPPTESTASNPRAKRKPVYTAEERRARSERLRTKWEDPHWRAGMLARRRRAETLQKMSESAKRLWATPEYRRRMREARIGRPAPNKGISPTAVTRLRMSHARKGGTFSDETRRKMSEAKLNRPEGDTWRKLISESKRGKTKEYFQMRREFRALHRDLKLWSDSYRAQYGKLPDASTYERFVAPMMILRIRRYLVLRDTIGKDEPDISKDIITDN